MNAQISAMTVAQLKQELTSVGVKFSSKMKKDDLSSLLIAHKQAEQAPAEVQEEQEVPAEEVPVVEEEQEPVKGKCVKCGRKCLGNECLAHDPERMNYRNLNLTVEADTVEAQVEKPKRKRAPKVKEVEEVQMPNIEEMTIVQIREFLSANGMEKQLEHLNVLVEKIQKPKKEAKKEVKKREPSVYNLFMKDEMASLKEQFPEMNHKERFSMAVANWKDSEKNPKNQ